MNSLEDDVIEGGQQDGNGANPPEGGADPSPAKRRAVLEDEDEEEGAGGLKRKRSPEGEDEEDEDDDEDFQGSEEDEDEEDEEEDDQGGGFDGPEAVPKLADPEAERQERIRRRRELKAKRKARKEKERRKGQDGKPRKEGAKKKKRARNAFIDDVAAEGDDDENEEFDPESRRRAVRNAFIDDIADITDEDEEEDEEEEGFVQDFLARDEDEGAVRMGEHQRLFRQLAQAQDDERMGEEDEQRLQEYFRERFRNMQETADEGGEGAVGQQALLPKPSDPKLWSIRCRPGRERETLALLMNKANYARSKGLPLSVQSAFCREDVKGFVYVEAFKLAHVRDAVRDIPTLLLGYGISVVPLADMVTSITPGEGKAAAGVAVGDWVRLKTSGYKGDLAKVVEVDNVEGRAAVKLLPRVDFAEFDRKEKEKEQRRADGEKAERRAPGRRDKIRPNAKPFNPEEARALRLEVIVRNVPGLGDVMEVARTMQFIEGYLLKRVSLKSLVKDESPTLEEVRRFQTAARDAEELGDEIDRLARHLPQKADLRDQAAAFEKGERVVVVRGDLKAVTGTVLAVHPGGQVDVQPFLAELGASLTLPASQLAKYWEAGDVVRVARGEHEGLVGDVVRITREHTAPGFTGSEPVVVFSLGLQKEVEVAPRDLVRAGAAGSDVGGKVLDRFGDYGLFDLVVLDQATVGVIVGVEKTHCRVLTNGGTPTQPDVRPCTQQDIKRRLAASDKFAGPPGGKREQFAQDMYRSAVNVGDSVTVMKGDGEGRTGQVRYIHRGALFLQSRDLLENGGYFCAKAQNCRVKGGLGGPQTAAGGLGAGALRPGMTPQLGGSSQAMQAALTAGRGGMAGSSGAAHRAPPPNRRDPMVGKKVTIERGQLRGYRGIVIDVLEDSFLVELESQYKNVSVRKDYISGQAGALPPVMRTGGANLPAGMTPHRTPNMAGGFTPAHNAFTPAHNAFTPAHNAFTPAHNAFTPAHNAFTPAHNAFTPAHPGMGVGATPRMGGLGGVPREPEVGGGAFPGGVPRPTGQAPQPIVLANPDELRLLLNLLVLAKGRQGAVIDIQNDGGKAIVKVQTGTREGAGELRAGDEDPADWHPLDSVFMLPVARSDTARVFTGPDAGKEARVVTVDAGSGTCVLSGGVNKIPATVVRLEEIGVVVKVVAGFA